MTLDASEVQEQGLVVKRGGDPGIPAHDTDFVNPARGNWTPNLSTLDHELAHMVQAGILADEAEIAGTAFTPAETIEVAVQRLKDELGIEVGMLDAENPMSLTLANESMRFFESMRQAYPEAPMPMRLNISAKHFQGMDNMAGSCGYYSYGRFGKQGVQISLNPISKKFQAGYLPSRANLYASDHPFATIHHEYGHAYQAMTDRGNYTRIKDLDNWMKTFKVTEAKIVKDVSDYAATDATEFVAEVFSGKVAGKEYPAWVDNLYAKLKGPKLDDHFALLP